MAAQNFGGQPEVLTMVMVVGVPGLVLLLAYFPRNNSMPFRPV